MTFRIQVRRYANAKPYTFALCETPREVETAMDDATRAKWPVIDVQVLCPEFREARARIEAGESISSVRDDLDTREPQPKPLLYRFFDFFFGRAEA